MILHILAYTSTNMHYMMTVKTASKTVRIGSQGRGLYVTITDLARALGVDRGDIVQITVERLEDED